MRSTLCSSSLFLRQCGWVWVRGFNQQVTRFPVDACGTLACHVIFSILGGGCHHSLIKENKGFGLCFACAAARMFAGSDGIRQRDRTRIDDGHWRQPPGFPMMEQDLLGISQSLDDMVYARSDGMLSLSLPWLQLARDGTYQSRGGFQ